MYIFVCTPKIFARYFNMYVTILMLVLSLTEISSYSIQLGAKVVLSSPEQMEISKYIDDDTSVGFGANLRVVVSCGGKECAMPAQFCDTVTTHTCRSCQTWCRTSGENFCKRHCPCEYICGMSTLDISSYISDFKF